MLFRSGGRADEMTGKTKRARERERERETESSVSVYFLQVAQVPSSGMSVLLWLSLARLVMNTDSIMSQKTSGNLR